MQYFATHYWQSGDGNVTSLVLQQAFHKRRKMPVLLACVEKNAGSENLRSENLRSENLLSQRLADWFYGSGLALCSRRGERGMENVAADLEGVLMKEICSYIEDNKEIGGFQFTGIFCVGEYFLLFRRGVQKITMLNTRNNQPYCHDLAMPQGNTGINLQTGILQRNVGILLATDGFHEAVSQEEMEGCLNISELCTETHLERRLRELGDFAERNGGKNLGAVLIVTH